MTTNAVHENDGKIFVQLMHTGRIAHPDNLPESAKLVGPSAVAAAGEMWTDTAQMQPQPAPHELTTDEVKATIQEYVQAAKNAIEAGFDGVELHGANGYLIEQFIAPNANQRTDEYGGSVENRSRFALEIAEATGKAIGFDKVGIRLSPYGVFNDIKPYPEADETYRYLAEKLNELGLVYLHLVNHASMGAPPVPETLVEAIRKRFTNTLILSGGYDAEQAEADLDSGKADLVAFGRPILANPDFVERSKIGADLNQPNPDTFYAPGPKGFEQGYIDYPTLEEVQA